MMVIQALRNTRCCHHPRRRVIQYMMAPAIESNLWGYWMPAFAGMTSENVAAKMPITPLSAARP
jgi:hypothetical protein